MNILQLIKANPNNEYIYLSSTSADLKYNYLIFAFCLNGPQAAFLSEPLLFRKLTLIPLLESLA